MRTHTLIILLLVLTVKVSAQVNLDDLGEINVFSTTTEKNKNGKYKAQKIKGKISGMGVFQSKNGSLYYGDLFDKQFQGKGTLVSIDSVKNCPGCVIYVGRFKEGLKNGKGRCYNGNGELIYEGKFKDDKPVDNYPNLDVAIGSTHYFSEFRTDDYHFIGEFEGDSPDGEGMLIFTNGDIYITPFADGIQDGLSVYIQADGNWECEKNERGKATLISSSAEYASLRKRAKENFKAGLSVALNYFSEAAQAGSQLTSQIRDFSSNGGSTSLSSGYSGDDGSYSPKKGVESGDKYNISEQQSYNRDKSTYHKYDGLLSKAFAGNSSASESEIKEWQSKMKKLREKWESRGRDFPHFANEDK